MNKTLKAGYVRRAWIQTSPGSGGASLVVGSGGTGFPHVWQNLAYGSEGLSAKQYTHL